MSRRYYAIGHGSGGSRISPHRTTYAPFSPNSDRSREIRVNGANPPRTAFGESRDFSANIRNCFRATARWICAIYSDFSGHVGIMRKRGILGAVGRNMRPPGTAVDRIGSSCDREISRRLSETVSWPPNGECAPFTRISPDLSGFGENGAYVVRRGEIRGPPDPWSIAYDLQEIAKFLGESQKLHHAPRAVSLRHLLGWVSLDLSEFGESGAYMARGAWGYATAGYEVGRRGSSGNREIPSRASPTVSGPPRGGFDPVT